MLSNYPTLLELVNNGTGTEVQPGLTPEPVSKWPASPGSAGKAGGQRRKGVIP